MTPDQARADERARVVAWLRRISANLTAQGRRALEMAADNIEQDAHHKEQGNG